jgi:hypothetical protein
VGALIGLLAVFLTDLVSRRRDAAIERKRLNAARAMLRAEIEHNLKLLAADMQDTAESPAGATTKIDLLALIPCPHWSTEAWIASLPLAHVALDPNTLTSVQGFYSQLRSLSQARASFAALEIRPEGATIGDLAELRGRSMALAEKLAHAGNPMPTA